MITHNMKSALSTGNRTLMMNQGKIIQDLNADDKRNMDVDTLMHRFKDALNDDRILLTQD